MASILDGLPWPQGALRAAPRWQSPWRGFRAKARRSARIRLAARAVFSRRGLTESGSTIKVPVWPAADGRPANGRTCPPHSTTQS